MKQNWCGLIWISPGMQNFEKNKRKTKTNKKYWCGLIWINPGMQNFENKKRYGCGLIWINPGMQNFENKKIYWCGLIWINPGMQNFEENKTTKTRKNEDLATSPDIRVVVETLFFFCSLQSKGRSHQSIREPSQD